jgi:hypothetical protein
LSIDRHKKKKKPSQTKMEGKRREKIQTKMRELLTNYDHWEFPSLSEWLNFFLKTKAILTKETFIDVLLLTFFFLKKKKYIQT